MSRVANGFSRGNGAMQNLSHRKRALFDHAEANGGEQYQGGKFNDAYRENDLRFMGFLIPPGKRVLELGCGRGDLLASLRPAYGVGIDFSPRTIASARTLNPELQFVLGDAKTRRRWKASRVRSTTS
jgi:SAM-dependent methyltransferase